MELADKKRKEKKNSRKYPRKGNIKSSQAHWYRKKEEKKHKVTPRSSERIRK